MASQDSWSGWIVFAGFLIVIVGALDILQGFVGILQDEYVVATAKGLAIVDVTTWGWMTLLWGGLLVLAGLGLLGVVTGAVIVNLLRGRTDLDCGCGGAGGDQRLSWGLVLRNALLAAALAFAAARPGERDLVWLDYATMLVATLSLFGLYAGANQLLANRPQLALLEGG